MQSRKSERKNQSSRLLILPCNTPFKATAVSIRRGRGNDQIAFFIQHLFPLPFSIQSHATPIMDIIGTSAIVHEIKKSKKDMIELTNKSNELETIK